MSFVGSALLLLDACALEFADIFEAMFAKFVRKKYISENESKRTKIQ